MIMINYTTIEVQYFKIIHMTRNDSDCRGQEGPPFVSSLDSCVPPVLVPNSQLEKPLGCTSLPSELALLYAVAIT